MPWSPAQHRLFEAAAHDKKIADVRGLTQEEADKLAKEGVKKAAEPGFIDLEPVFGSARGE